MSLLSELTATYREREALRDAALQAFAMTYVDRVRQAVQAHQPSVEFSTTEMVAAWAKEGFGPSDIVLYVGDVFRREELQVNAESRKVDKDEFDVILIVSGWAK
jgi:hypothetical protein